MTQGYRPEDLIDSSDFFAAIEAEDNLAPLQWHVRNELRSLFSALNDPAIRQESFTLPEVVVNNDLVEGSVLFWTEQGTGDKKRFEMYKIKDEEQYLLKYDCDSEEATRICDSKFVVRFSSELLEPQIMRPGGDTIPRELWEELAEILASMS